MNAFAPGSRARPAVCVNRLGYATMVATDAEGVEATLRRRFGNDPATLHLLALTRGAVAPLATSDPAWAPIIAAAATADYFASLAPLSALARLLTTAVRIDLSGRQTLSIPGRVGRPRSALGIVPEAQPIPVGAQALGGVVLRRAKLAGVVVLTAEVARGPAGQGLFEALLREDVSASLDSAVFSDLPGDEDTPAGLLAGAVEVVAAAAGPEAALTDAEALGTAVLSAGGGVSVVYVAAPGTAFRLGLRLPQQNLTIWPSLGLPEGKVVALDPAAVALHIDPAPRFNVSDAALLHMDTAPTQIGTAGAPATVAAPTRSLWQTDTIGLRMIAEAAWALRAPAIAVVDDVNW